MNSSEEKPDKGMAQSLSVDGSKIRAIRERKRLTQLYVASVVGVTTDTISRWENNRYPSMKRDNVEKLATALEVELFEILRDEVVEPEEPPLPAAEKRRPSLWLLIPLLVLVGAALLLYRLATPAPVAKRWAPRFAAPGEVIPIQVKVTRQHGKQNGFILKERLPKGWELVTTTPTTATVEAPGSVVKWLIPKGADPVTVSYTTRIPGNAPLGSKAKISGDVIFQLAGLNHIERTGGEDAIAIAAYHWADANGDGRIDDNEIMPAYYLCEEMKGFNLDWKTIEAIWSGKGYRWTPQQGYSVVK